MASILFYTSPAKGHLYPILGAALELHSRGHQVHVRTLSGETERVRSLGPDSEPIAAAIEARELDDWKANSPLKAVELAMKTFGDRSGPEVDDLQAAIRTSRAEILVIDANSWGAQAAAEASGVPWALFQPYFTYLPARGVPPFGPGLPRMKGAAGRLRDNLLGKVILSKLNKAALPAINPVRKGLGLDPLYSIPEMLGKPDLVLYYTSRELDYPREEWPENFRFVGPGLWSPAAEPPAWLDDIEQPLALVTCSTERQSDRPIIEAALKSLPGEGFFVVATSAAYDSRGFEVSDDPNVHLAEYIPHDPVVERASVVICHGGMGITQRALSRGVPVVVIPFGRDQPEVARRVEYAGAGVCLMPKKLNAETLKKAVQDAIRLKPGAERIGKLLRAAGDDRTVAGLIEGLQVQHHHRKDVAV